MTSRVVENICILLLARHHEQFLWMSQNNSNRLWFELLNSKPELKHLESEEFFKYRTVQNDNTPSVARSLWGDNLPILGDYSIWFKDEMRHGRYVVRLVIQYGYAPLWSFCVLPTISSNFIDIKENTKMWWLRSTSLIASWTRSPLPQPSPL